MFPLAQTYELVQMRHAELRAEAQRVTLWRTAVQPSATTRRLTQWLFDHFKTRLLSLW